MAAESEQSKKEKDEHWWFQGASVRTLVQRLAAAQNLDLARLEVRVHGKKMTFRVVLPQTTTADGEWGEASTESHDDEDINDSHLCPPRCPRPSLHNVP